MTEPDSADKTVPVSNLEQKLAWAILLLLLAGCLLVLRPFVIALLWSAILCSASWPLYARLLRLLRHHNTIAACVMTLAIALVVVLPLVIVGTTLADNVKDLTKAIENWTQSGLPQPPEWLGKVPLVGASAVKSWQDVATDTGSLMGRAERWIPMVSKWLLTGGLFLGHGLLQLVLSLFIAFFLFRDGAYLHGRITAAVERIGSQRGLRLLDVARNTVRGVVYGILGTALLQAVFMGLGLFIAGVPGVALLSLLTFFASILPAIGTGIVSIPVAIWLFYQDSTAWGIFMIIWGLIVGSFDNLVKPWLISHGSDMPFLLIFFGVIGGIIAFGFIGIFVGPTLLAIGFRISEEWMSGSQRTSPEAKAAK